MTRIIDPRNIWNVIYNARSNRHHPPTSPNAVPATKNDSHHWSSWHMKRHLQCAEQQASPSNATKYCTCHEKWHAWLILVTYETSFTMRGTTGITLQPHQILRLPRKDALQNLRKICRKQLKRQFQCATDLNTIRTRSDHELVISHPPVRRGYFSASETHFVLKITTFRAPAIYPDFTEYCACHDKWHSNITKCCACHEKWHSDITKYCACHEKWHSKITKCCACHEKWHSNITKYCACHELGLETWMHCYFTVTLLLHCYFTVTFTALLLYCYFYCTVTLLLLLLDSNCYCTGLFAFLNLRNSEVSQLNFIC